MPDPTPQPQDPQAPTPLDKPQHLGADALQRAPEVTLPIGLPMLEPLPPLGEEPTQPIQVHPSSLPLDPEAELRALLGGPDATLRLQAGAPELGATSLLQVGEPALPGATQVLPVGAPAPHPGEPQIPNPNVRTMRISPDELPTPGRKRVPLWGWVSLGTLVLLLGLGSVYFLRPELLGLGTAETRTEESASQEADPSAPPPQISETPVVEVPPALRSYVEKADKGDAAAMRMLGVMYYNGLNVPKNEQEGLKWYRKAADHGSKAAQKELKLLEEKIPSK